MEQTQLAWKSVGHLLEDAAVRHGEKALILFEDGDHSEQLTFAEANTRANRLANLFLTLGLSRGDRVSVMLPNGIDFPVAWFGIAKAGLTMVPTNSEYQSHDLAYLLSDSEASCMIIHADFVSRLEEVRDQAPTLAHVLVVGDTPAGCESFRDRMADQSSEYSIAGIDEMDVLNIQYTSGTTGFPKGCMLPHRYWMLMGHIGSQTFDFSADDVDFNAQPFYYMDPQWNVILCLMTGMSLVLVPRFSVSRFWRTVVDNEVTFFYCLGTMPLMLLDREPDDLERAHRVRGVSCSGIPAQLHETIEKRFGCPWREGYGTTESGTDLLVRFDEAECVGSGSLGKPPASKEARIADGEGNELPDGEIGELVLRGEPLMLGYWRKPEATEEVFRNGWFHSGDLFYKDDEGSFHIVGRKKDMVRRSGENISTAEVEAVLAEHPMIRLSAVVPVPDRIRGEEAKAYIVLKEGVTQEAVPPQRIVEFARSRLAAFKVPRYVEYVSSLPMTPSERVEKHKLIEATEDLRLGSYDVAVGSWLTQADLEQKPSN